MTTFNAFEPFSAASKAMADAALTFANVALASSERLAALNLNTVRSSFEDGAVNAKLLMDIKDPQGLVSLQSGMVSQGVEKAVAYSRSVSEITAQTQEELMRLAEIQFADFQKNFASAVDKASSAAPAGSEYWVPAVKSGIAAANQAFASASKATRQAVEMAEANIAAAGNATVKAINAGAPKKKAA